MYGTKITTDTITNCMISELYRKKLINDFLTLIISFVLKSFLNLRTKLKTTIMTITKQVLDAIQIWINTEGVYLSKVDTNSVVYRKQYNEECRLYSEFFPNFSPSESQTYREIVTWLHDTELWKSDLTLMELINLYSN